MLNGVVFDTPNNAGKLQANCSMSRYDLIPISTQCHSNLYLLLLDSYLPVGFFIGRARKAFAASPIALGQYASRIGDMWNRRKKQTEEGKCYLEERAHAEKTSPGRLGVWAKTSTF